MIHLQAVTEELARTPPDVGVVLGSAALAGTLLWMLWFAVVHALTVAHEGGHALLLLLVGARVEAVRIDRVERRGATLHRPLGWPAELPVVLAGYSAPPMFGVLGAFLLAKGLGTAVLWLSVLLLALLLTAARNVFGFLYIALIGLGFVVAARRGSPEVQELVATTWVWLLLFGGLLRIVQRGRRAADFGKLREMTFIPTFLWAGAFALLALAAIVVAGTLLFGGLDAPGS